jgi:Tol biopolymer transport system component
VAYSSTRNGTNGIFVRSISPENDELWLQTPEIKVVNDWSPDGRFLVFVSGTQTTKQDIWLLPTTGDRKPSPYLRTPADEIQAQVSPDGKWLAYASDESGRWEVYVQSFPVPGSKRTVSVNGGGEPQWRRDGHELFYLTPDHLLMAVEVKSGETFNVGNPKPLFRTSILGTLLDVRNHYAAATDGQHFLISSRGSGAPPEAITVIMNWTVRANSSTKPH